VGANNGTFGLPAAMKWTSFFLSRYDICSLMQTATNDYASLANLYNRFAITGL